MNMYLCRGVFRGRDVAFVLYKDDDRHYTVNVEPIGYESTRDVSFGLGDGIEAMVASCNMSYPDVLSRVQHAIHRLSVTSRLESLSRPSVPGSCSDDGACGQ